MFSIQADEQQDLRILILTAARELLAAGTEFSMRSLANRIGCSPGTIYLYFQNKSELLQCLAEENSARLNQLLEGLKQRHSRGDPVVLLKKALYTCVEFRLRHPEPDHANASGLLVPAEFVREFVRRCVQEDAFRREVDADAACLSLCATTHGLGSMLIAGAFQTDRRALMEHVINTAVEGLCERSSNPRARAASVA